MYDVSKLTIVDIGCRWSFADKFLNNIDNINIYGFDPDAKECERIRKVYNDERVHLVPIGLGCKREKKTLYITKQPACSSLYKPDQYLMERHPLLECIREMHQVEIDLLTLDDWCIENNISNIDYLKIDTQGAELDILKWAVSSLKNIRFIDIGVEFNRIYHRQPIFSDINIFLREYGFELWKFQNICHYGTKGDSEKEISTLGIYYDEYRNEVKARGGQIFWADANYVKKEIIHTDLYEIPEKQRKKDYEMSNMLGLSDIASCLRNYQGKM